MKILLVVSEEKEQILGPDRINIQSIDMHQKVENLSTLTTLTIITQKEILTWEDFQHQLVIIVGVIF